MNSVIIPENVRRGGGVQEKRVYGTKDGDAIVGWFFSAQPGQGWFPLIEFVDLQVHDNNTVITRQRIQVFSIRVA